MNAPKLNDLCRQNIGWYLDKTTGDSIIEEWSLGSKAGLYFLWHKEDYCAQHERYHMTALYVGKGLVSRRFANHWISKDTSKQELIYFSFVPMANRIAKYIEQLLLDIYKFPLNKAENTGTKRLCAHFTQSEVD
uniref:hypothetical protein n=1 Tax=uncultured Rhizobium sp. TaxID=155567 RepID=UPI00261A1232|nr:hypothetical protein [uncultured Rhizobium sp.]